MNRCTRWFIGYDIKSSYPRPRHDVTDHLTGKQGKSGSLGALGRDGHDGRDGAKGEQGSPGKTGPRELQGHQVSMEIKVPKENLERSPLPAKRGSVEMRLLVRCPIMKTGKSAH